VTAKEPFQLVLTPPARRGIAHKLTQAAAAAAVIDFLTTALVSKRQRVGKPLQDDLAGIWSARRGA
jgi:mRNA interferase RelE/StbE